MTNTATPPELSFEVDLAGLPSTGKKISLQATQEECTLIAKRLGVIAVLRCGGEIAISATKKLISVSGTVRSELKRQCVASLEEMMESVADSFELEFFRDETILDLSDENAESDLVEVHEDEIFDVGELLVQQLALAMSPFPRKEGASSLAAEYGAQEEASPFAELQEILEKNN